MTLVVAAMAGGDICAVSDIRRIDRGQIRTGYAYGQLKLVVLTPGLAVAFADDVELALRGLREARELALAGAESMQIATQLATYADSFRDAQAEFVVLSARDPSITRAGKDGVQSNLPSAWIGDSEAFSAFQASRVAPPQIEPSGNLRQDTLSSFAFAMKGVIADPEIRGVGEASIRLSSSDGVFQYCPETSFYMPQPNAVPSGEWVTVPFGDAPRGGFACVVMPASTPGVGAIGLHFHQGALGYLYHPICCDDAVEYASYTQDEFASAVYRDYGIELDAGIKLS